MVGVVEKVFIADGLYWLIPENFKRPWHQHVMSLCFLESTQRSINCSVHKLSLSSCLLGAVSGSGCGIRHVGGILLLSLSGQSTANWLVSLWALCLSLSLSLYLSLSHTHTHTLIHTLLMSFFVFLLSLRLHLSHLIFTADKEELVVLYSFTLSAGCLERPSRHILVNWLVTKSVWVKFCARIGCCTATLWLWKLISLIYGLT